MLAVRSARTLELFCHGLPCDKYSVSLIMYRDVNFRLK